AQDRDEPEADIDADVRIVRHALLTDQQFAQQIFGHIDSIESARLRFETALESQVRRLDWQYGLTDAQKFKLLLAGQGDIKHVLDRVDELQQKFERVKFSQIETIQCIREAQKLRNDLVGGIFGAKSLLTKTIATTVTKEQTQHAHDRMSDYQSEMRDE